MSGTRLEKREGVVHFYVYMCVEGVARAHLTGYVTSRAVLNMFPGPSMRTCIGQRAVKRESEYQAE